MTEMPESSTVTVPPLTLGWRLQMAMSQAGMTRYSMAEALGVSIATITRWTSDKGAPKKAYITQWAWLTRVPVEWLDTGVWAPVSPDGGDVTTHGYFADPLPFPVSAVKPDTLSSHGLPWQLVTPLSAFVGSLNLPGGGNLINDQDRISSRSLSEHESSVAEAAPDSRVAA